MNSEIPPIPESDNSESLQPVDTESAEDRVEIKDESPAADKIDPPIDVESKVAAESIDNSDKQGSEIEIESDSWFSQALKATESLESQAPTIIPTDSESVSSESGEIIAESQAEPQSEPELFVDRWLDEPESESVNVVGNVVEHEGNVGNTLQSSADIAALKEQKAALKAEIAELQAQKAQIVLQQAKEVQEAMGSMVEEGLRELKDHKNVLQIEIEKLERRQERIRQEMRTNFAGASQELAVRVQGFKNYLVGSLQDLAAAADKLELSAGETQQPLRERERTPEKNRRRSSRDRDRDRDRISPTRGGRNKAPSPQPQFTEAAFADQNRKIRQLIEQYRSRPDYYGSPWQLRRTFEPIHAEKVQEWFFSQGGRGAIDSLASRLQNILIASAIISIVHHLYGDRCRVLVLIDTPEKLGEWRRGLQDCLGISRSDFGSNRGVVLFDSADVLVQRAERLVKDKLLPLIVIDETEELVNLALLKFPLWLAFASGNKPSSSNYLY